MGNGECGEAEDREDGAVYFIRIGNSKGGFNIWTGTFCRSRGSIDSSGLVGFQKIPPQIQTVLVCREPQ